MFRRPVPRRWLTLLLLLVLPFAALGGYARESAPACAMMGDKHAMVDTGGASDHCKRMHAPDTLPAKHTSHCSMCGDLGAPLPMVTSTPREHRVAVLLATPPSDRLVLSPLAAPWRPPRAL